MILIADRFTEPLVAERLVEAALADAPWIILRDRDVDRETFARAAEAVVGRLRALETPPRISITAHLRVAHALQTDLHIGKRDVSVAEARRALGASALIGYSAHDAPEARKAVEAGTDYLFFSPVFATQTKPGAIGAGIEALARFVDRVRGVPVFALGGVTPARVRPCLEAGAYGIAVVSGIMNEIDPATATRRYLAEATFPSP